MAVLAIIPAPNKAVLPNNATLFIGDSLIWQGVEMPAETSPSHALQTGGAEIGGNFTWASTDKWLKNITLLTSRIRNLQP